MKKIWLPLLILCVGFQAQAFRVGTVDLQDAMKNVKEGKRVKARFDKAVAAKKRSMEKRQAAFQKKAQAFEKKAALMNAKKKQETQQNLQRELIQLQKDMQSVNLELKKLEIDLTKPIMDKLRSIVEVMGKEKKYDLIVEKNVTAVLFAKNETDLTSDLVKRYNKSKKK